MNISDDIFDVLEQDEKFWGVMKRLMEMSMSLSFNGIVITTADPGYPIVYTNAAFCEMTGYSPDEVMGKSPSMLQGPLTDSEVLERLNRDIAGSNPFSSQNSSAAAAWLIISAAIPSSEGAKSDRT